MKIVMFENCNAIFDFELPDTIDRLKHYSDQNVHEATKILDAISSCPSPAIKVETDYFGYIVLDLIKAGKGHAYCKVCKETYDSNQLSSRPLGFGKSPFEVNLKEEGGIVKRIVKNLFGKKEPKIIGMRGGEAYDCSEHHVLISMITWIT
jgi:ferredoxin